MERVTRRSFLKATAGVVAAVTLPGCSDGGHTDQHIPTPQNTVFESAPSTSSPVNTTLVEKTTLPSTSSSTTTTEAPTTTAEPQPTDVVEHRDGYDVLRNGGILYQGEMSHLPEWFGGFELHLQDGGARYGFLTNTPGETGQEKLLNLVMWSFAAQDPSFVGSDNSVNIDAFKEKVEIGNGLTNVIIPKNINPDSRENAQYTPVVASDSFEVDFSKPVVFVGGNYNFSDAEFSTIQYYNSTPDSGSHEFIGITTDNQLYIGFFGTRPDGTKRNEFDPWSYTSNYAIIAAITANISRAGSGDPTGNFVGPYLNTIVPYGLVPAEVYNPDIITPDITKYVQISTTPGVASQSLVFGKLASK